MAGFDLEGARKAGVPDTDIANSLAPKLNYDVEGARKAGISDREIADTLANKFNSTPGGAATGNPSIQRQGDRAMRGLPSASDAAAAIGGAGVMGGVLGALGPEIMTGLGGAAGAFPATAPLRGPLLFMGNAMRTAGRPVAATAGAVSGAVGETAGQGVEAAGGGPTAAEIARIVGGAVGPELGTLAAYTARTVGKMPLVADVINVIKKASGRDTDLTAAQKAYLERELADLRGGAKTNHPLEEVGSLMGVEGQRLMDEADNRMIVAQAKAAGINRPSGTQVELADIGGSLRDSVVKRNQKAMEARSSQYTKNEQARDATVAQRESAGNTIDTTPEYKNIVAQLKAELKPGLHSPDVAADFEHILKQVSTKSKTTEQPFGGMGADPFASVTEGKPPVSFQQIDEVRRQLGEVFRGKPPEGYKALDAATAKKYYGQLSDLQKKYAGKPQSDLLDDYHAATEGLQIFSSKSGKKATALDQYREGDFATDASTLPGTYFKTRASVQALKDLTGNPTQVNHAALEFANRELAGMDSAAVRKWMAKNTEWLAETGPTRTLIDRYATKLEGAERSLQNANEFAAQAAKDNKLLTSNTLPAQRAVDLIKSGNTELWDKVVPAIVQSPQAKTQMVNAVRQVMADQATAKGTIDLFSRNVRPFLERSQIGSKAEMDFIAQKLENIARMEVPEAEKLGLARRLILQSAGGWAATAASRTGNSAFKWSKEKVVPD